MNGQASRAEDEAGEGGMGFGDRFKETEQNRRGKDTSSWGVM